MIDIIVAAFLTILAVSGVVALVCTVSMHTKAAEWAFLVVLVVLGLMMLAGLAAMWVRALGGLS